MKLKSYTDNFIYMILTLLISFSLVLSINTQNNNTYNSTHIFTDILNYV